MVALAALVLLSACSTTSTLPDGTLAPLGSGTYPLPSTTTTTVAPIGGTTTLPPGGLPGTTATGQGTSWGGWPYYEVPQLGAESVRGTGCGSTGGLGESIPDGVWNVLVGDGTGGDDFWTSDRITVDVRCVYSGVGGTQLWNAACTTDPQSDNCLQQSADWYVVNANGRLRTMPVAADVQYGVGALGGPSPCASVTPDRTSSNAPWRFMDSWIVITGGTVTAVVTACPAG